MDKAALGKLMYDIYIQNHTLINPWTAGFEVFCEKLPDRVLCSERDGKILGLAFVEENEIAFVCGRDPSRFRWFAYSLVVKLLGNTEQSALNAMTAIGRL